MLIVTSLCWPATTSRKKVPSIEDVEKEKPALPKLSAEAAKFQPWGVTRIFRVTNVQIGQPTSQSIAKPGVNVTGSADHFKQPFEGATIFQHPNGLRMIPSSAGGKEVAIDYIEINKKGSGFGVNSEEAGSTAHLYLNNVKFTAPAVGITTGTTTLDADAEINYTGSSATKKENARIHLAAVVFFEKPVAAPTPKGAEAKATTKPTPQPTEPPRHAPSQVGSRARNRK